jgi:fructokinase
MPERRSVLTAGYMPLDIIEADGVAWQRAGGTAGNVAAILGFLGWSSALVGRVGSDAAGVALRADLERSGVDCELISIDPAGLTNRLVHEIRQGRHRYRYSCPKCSQKLPRSRPLRIEQVDDVLATHRAPSVYFFDRANAATVELAERYAEANTIVVFEPSTPANAQLLQRAMNAATFVKGSHEHGPDLVATYEAGNANRLRVITEGVAGARFRRGRSRWQRVAAFGAEVIDAAGAGDWTTAGMLHKLVGTGDWTAPKAIADAITFGHALAALNCAVPGARGLSEDRDRAQVLADASMVLAGRCPTLKPNAHWKATAPGNACSWCLLSIDSHALSRAAGSDA